MVNEVTEDPYTSRYQITSRHSQQDDCLNHENAGIDRKNMITNKSSEILGYADHINIVGR
uniref:Uncharacterized protein n=1 Tax=Megaselia scalaris TaxID=36166 RepID=T1GI28_MEGSC